jgi:hypothetical protein
MRCKKVQKLIIAYLDNELSNRRQNAIQIHLARCSNCSAELESYKKLNGIIEQCPKVENRSPLFWQNQINAIERKAAEINSGKKPEPTIQLRRYQPVWYKYAAATATISIVAIILILNQSHQPVSSIVAIEKVPNTLIAAKPSAPDKSEEDKKVSRSRRMQPTTSKLQPIKDMNADNIIANEPEKALADKAERKLEGTELYAKNGDKDIYGIHQNLTGKLSPAAPAPMDELKAGKAVAFKAKAYGSYAYSTIPAENRMETAMSGQVRAPEAKGAAQEGAYLGLSRGTSAYFGQGQALFFNRDSMAQNIQAMPGAIQTNLAFDSAQLKMMQEAMEMMVKTNFPNQQNQRTIEIKEIPQPAVSSPRHIQINMEFNE